MYKCPRCGIEIDREDCIDFMDDAICPMCYDIGSNQPVDVYPITSARAEIIARHLGLTVQKVLDRAIDLLTEDVFGPCKEA